MKRTVLFVVLFLLCTLAVRAQLTVKAEYIGRSPYRDDQTDEKISNYKGSSVIYQADLNIPLSVKMNPDGLPQIWAINSGAAYARLDNRNFRENLVTDEIFDLYLGLLNITPFSKKWMITTSVGIGIYSPTTCLSRLTSKQVLANAAVLFICNVRPNLQIGGGLAVNNTFGYPMAFPALYLKWSTQGRWGVDINMTSGLAASGGYRFTDNVSLSLVLEISGQVAFLQKDGKDMMFSHQYMISGFRPQFRLGKYISLPLTVGVNAMRMAAYNKRTLKAMFVSSEPGGYFSVSPYFSAGLSIGF